MLLSALDDASAMANWLYNGGGETLISYGVKAPEGVGGSAHACLNCSAPFAPPFRKRIAPSFPRCRRMVDFDPYLFVHAGIRPGMPDRRPGPGGSRLDQASRSSIPTRISAASSCMATRRPSTPRSGATASTSIPAQSSRAASPASFWRARRTIPPDFACISSSIRRTGSACTRGGLMSRILVTGGAGYIGSHCCKALADAGLRAGRLRQSCRRGIARRSAGARSSKATCATPISAPRGDARRSPGRRDAFRGALAGRRIRRRTRSAIMP